MVDIVQVAHNEAEAQLADLQQEAAARQDQIATQAEDISSLRDLAEAHIATSNMTAKQAEEKEQQLMANVAALNVSLSDTGECTVSVAVLYALYILKFNLVNA